MKWICLLLVLTMPGNLLAEERSYLLEGTIGPYEVFMNLSSDGVTGGAVYFYKSSLHDIKLRGIAVNDSIILYCNSYNPELNRQDTSETLFLKPEGNSASGRWVSNTGKSLQVSLHRVNLNEIKNPFANLSYVLDQKSEDAFNYLRIACMKIVSEKTEKRGKYTIEYVHIDKSEVRVPRVTSGCDKLIMDKINGLIDNACIENACMFFSCSSFLYELRGVFINDDMISINTFAEFDCGGPHPDGANESLNINVKTGTKLALEDILYLSPSTIPATESDEWLTYRDQVFAPKLIALLKKLFPAQMKDKGADDDCDYSRSDVWSFSEWYIMDKGLYLLPQFPHVSGPCRDPGWSIIPFSVLKKYANPVSGITLP